jgi:hypothetical protein
MTKYYFKSFKDIEQRYCLTSLHKKLESFCSTLLDDVYGNKGEMAAAVDGLFQYISDRYHSYINKKNNFNEILIWCNENLQESNFIWYDQTIWFKSRKDLMFFLLKWSN